MLKRGQIEPSFLPGFDDCLLAFEKPNFLMVWIFDFATINEIFSDPLLEGDQARRCQDQSRLLSRNKSPLDAARRDLLARWEVRFRTYDAGKRTVVVGWFFAKKSVDTFLNLTSGNGVCLLQQKWGLKQKKLDWIKFRIYFTSIWLHQQEWLNQFSQMCHLKSSFQPALSWQ